MATNMFQSVGNVPDPHASLLTLTRTNTMTASSGEIRDADDRWDYSDDDDEYVERLVIDVDASLCTEQEYADISSASEDRGPSHLKEILQTGVYTGRYENVFKQSSGEWKEKKLKPNSETSIKKEHTTLSADRIQKTLNCRADEYMRNNFMQYRAENVENFKSEGKLSCNLCDRTFKFRSNLCRHKKHAHTDVKPHRCDVCHRTFLQHSSLVAHAKSHTDDKPFGCDLCPRRFAYRSNLAAHARVHAGYKPYTCDVCDAKFTRKFILTAHRRTHTGEKPFACPVCERRYTNKTNLQNHTRIHDVCDSQVDRKLVLTGPERTLAASKPFVCQVCGKSFSRNFSLKVHTRTHTGDKPFACSLCSAAFSCYQYLKVHRSRHRGEEPNGDLDKYRGVLERTLKKKQNGADERIIGRLSALQK